MNDGADERGPRLASLSDLRWMHQQLRYSQSIFRGLSLFWSKCQSEQTAQQINCLLRQQVYKTHQTRFLGADLL